MRKLWILFLLLCLGGRAVGQDVDDILSYLPPTTKAERIRYWFDDIGAPSVLSQLGGAQTVDVSHLPDGLHTLHCQIVDDMGAVAAPQTVVFLKFTKEATAVTASTLRYWFDDSNAVTTTTDLSGTKVLDVSTMLDGLHTLHYQVVDTNGKVTPPCTQVFLKVPQYTGDLAPRSLIYWYDDETDHVQSMPMAQGIQVLDAGALEDGLHTLHYQVVCSDGSLTSAYSSIFLRMSKDFTTGTARYLRYWYDDQLTAQQVDAVSGVQLLDASALMQGLHTLHYQVADENGTLGAPLSAVFLKMDMDGTQQVAKRQRYWFDDDASTLFEGDVTTGTQILDVSKLSLGLHTLHYQLADATGALSAPQTSVFIKMGESLIADGKNGITGYMYWMNDRSKDNVRETLPQAVNPYQLVALLPTIKAPIRSNNYLFEITDGRPMMYARNDIHVRFYDAAGYWADDARSFIDYSVSRAVDDATPLDATQTFERPAENDVKWFTFEAEKGDSIAFSSSQATSLQVFSPTSKEVYAASADQSVKFGGCHVWEDGTYYVAVHDVTGTKPNVTLDYMHMDRYAVVSQDVYTVGNGGFSTITYQGNGFNDLYAVELYNAQGDTIKSVYISHDDNSVVNVTFDFTDVPIGMYDADFHFTIEDKMKVGYLKIEESKDITITTKVDYPSTYSRYVVYTCSITNNGNLTAYNVPVFTYIKSQTQDGIYRIEYDGIEKRSILDEVNSQDSLSSEDIVDLSSYIASLDDDRLFIKMWADDDDGIYDSIFVRSNYFFVNLKPNETKVLRLKIFTNELETCAYFTVPDDWPAYTSQNSDEVSYARSTTRSSSLKSKYCCVSDKITCVASNLSMALDVASVFSGLFGPQVAALINVSDCVMSGTTAVNKTLSYMVCDGDAVNQDPWRAARDVTGATIQAGLSCISAKLNKYGIKYLKNYNPRLKSIGDMLGKLVVALDVFSIGKDAFHGENPFKCLTEIGKPKPGCPPKDPNGGNTQGGKSYDPNDIYGYTAESGSRYMTDKVQQVNYRIEFENDPEFATASAHVVEIRDTLNAKYFDLDSYAPTGIKIGDRTELLDGKPQFVRTIDMRPQINAIAQVEGFYNRMKGIVTYRFTSIDPMTMEPTDDVMQGFLPVNADGTSGIGEVSYNVNLLKTFADGTQITNRASIVFDTNDPILTPVWQNTIDAVSPVSKVTEVVTLNDSTARVRCEGTDERSGVWRYEVYAQYGSVGTWEKVGTCNADSAWIDFPMEAHMSYGFCALAIDSAGNVEVKDMVREAELVTYVSGDANGDGVIDIEDVVTAVSHYLGEDTPILFRAADVNGDGVIDIEDVVGIREIYLGAATPQAARLRSTTKRQRLRTVMQQ